jgi:tetratricopeptide (TPR) repeat protein
VLVPAEEDATPVEHALGIRRLVGQIANVLYGEEGRRVLAAPVAQLGPLELAVRSWAVYYAAPTLAGIDEGLRLADIALASDPNSVVALNSKAFLLGNRYDEDAHPDHERYARDLDALSARAVALDPRDVYAWMNRRTALMHAGRWPAALEAVDRAVELDGGSPGTLLEKADLLSYLGRPEAALELLAAEPLRSRHDAVAWAIACHSRLLLGQVADAVGACQKALGGDPSMWYVHLYLAAAQARAGRLDEARASLAVVDRMSPGYTLERLRNHRRYAQPDYRRLAEATYYAGLREAGMPER